MTRGDGAEQVPTDRARLHGFDLDAEDERLLRSPPPPAALAWCADAVGAGARVVRAVPLEGGTSSAVHAVDVETAGGALRRLVLRRLVRADWLAEEPDVAQREAAALARGGRQPRADAGARGRRSDGRRRERRPS